MQPSLADIIGRRARENPDGDAYRTADSRMTWAEYELRSQRLARRLVSLGLEPGERVGVLLPDGPGVHVVFVGIEKAGLIAVGVGPRAGEAEIRHLLSLTGARAWISRPEHRGVDTAALFERWQSEGLALRHHLVVAGELEDDAAPADDPVDGQLNGELDEALARRRLGPGDVFLLNSTSGTTGMPKCVVHDQLRWMAFHDFAVEAGELCADDLFLSTLPAPFGFGIWTGHVTPTLLGVPTVLTPSFSAEETLALIEQYRVTVLAAVSTQFIMMLSSPAFERHELGSLRVLFTGGEAVPYERALEFEERTGAAVLQFYGSNETGAVSGTTLRDSREQRLRTAGRVIPEMNVRLFDENGADVTAGGRGQPGCKGPTLSGGYYGDEAANRKLVRPDGWMLLGDMAEIDAEGYLRVIGRSDDFIIRGGMNVSAVAVEAAVGTHPAVALAAAVAMPDPVFGERVCVYVELQPGQHLTLDELTAHLAECRVSVETFPERLVVVDALPRSAGGKVAKGQLREDARRQVVADAEEPGAPVS